MLPVLALGGALFFSACSSADAPAQDGGELLSLTAMTQPRAIQAGKTFLGQGLSSSSYRLVSAGDSSVAKVGLTEAGLRIEARRTGWTTIQLASLGAEARTEHLTLYVSGERPRLATEYFAPANVRPDGAGFASDDARESGYFTFEEAQGLRLSTAAGDYRLPTKRELHALLPYQEMLEYGREQFRTYMEQVTLGGETKKYLETFYTPGRGVAYAIRFERAGRAGEDYAQDNRQRTAFRYTYTQRDGIYRLRITARYLGEHFAGDINYVAQEGFWQSYTWDDQTVELPALGVRDPEGRVSSFGALGEYWSASAGYDDLSASALGFGTSSASSTIHADRAMARPVRLILDIKH